MELPNRPTKWQKLLEQLILAAVGAAVLRPRCLACLCRLSNNNNRLTWLTSTPLGSRACNSSSNSIQAWARLALLIQLHLTNKDSSLEDPRLLWASRNVSLSLRLNRSRPAMATCPYRPNNSSNNSSLVISRPATCLAHSRLNNRRSSLNSPATLRPCPTVTSHSKLALLNSAAPVYRRRSSSSNSLTIRQLLPSSNRCSSPSNSSRWAREVLAIRLDHRAL